MRKSNTNTTKNRCSLWGTKAIAITSILLAIMSGCGHDRMDTEPNPPNNVKETIVCTTNTTASTSKVSTTTTTAIATMTSMTTTTETTAKNTAIILVTETEMPKKNTITSKSTEKTTNKTTITEPITTKSTTTETVPVVEEYVVYKPSTHYIHKNTCRWNNGDAYKIDNTGGIEVRRCSECNPDMEIVNEYIPPVENNGYGQYTESDAILLAQLIHRESSVTWEGRVAVASCVINRCGYFGDTISGVIFAPNQFTTANNLNYYTTEDYNAAVYVLTNGTIDSRIFYFDGCHPDMKNWFYDINYNYIGAY